MNIGPDVTLLELLRDHLKLKGTHQACDTASCGACTVLVNHQAVKSCGVLALQCQGKNVHSVESLAQGAVLHPLQKNFSNHHALQCGFCTPGFLMVGIQLLKEQQLLSKEEIAEKIKGNLCRCTGYVPIIDAIHQTLKESLSLSE